MTVMLAGLNDIYRAKEDLEEIKLQYAGLYEQLHHVVSLTRQLQIKYGYMGSLLRDEDLPGYQPQFVRESILTLYQREVQKLKDLSEFKELQVLMKKHSKVGDSKLFLLILGAKPELLQGSTIIK
ncbi:hypothetical protein [Halobacillus sp. A5]|uniref:hypothetical protein n=1 Tax=Halobacillus sp. A5 TaxID=2880263 RepID=UPI0020A68CFC|nr:hypothetical protein [Halobacillus sp. A5]MCP3028122.1 hypothetical protein [Halobacillus sp. A5]